MDFEFSAEEQAFAREVEAFLDEHATPEVADVCRENMAQIVDTPARRAFMKKLAERGWLGMTWPREYGGREMSGVYEYILNEALARRGAPQIGKGVGIIGKTLIRHGSEKLKREFLPKIIRAEIEFAVGYSEPEAGSDAANMQLKAEKVEPEATAQALSTIRGLYRVEAEIRERELEGGDKLTYRTTHAKPLVDAFFAWVDQQCHRPDLLPKSPLAAALNYAREREGALRVYLTDPRVPIDTNHLERALRPIPLGRKNWLFAWTETGAQQVGIIQSLIATCRLHGIHPYTYLVDVLQRVSLHPASQVEDLTPRRWKERFAAHPLLSDLDKVGK